MNRAKFILRDTPYRTGLTSRQIAMRAVQYAPESYTVTVSEPRRSTEQNDRMWAMLTDIVRSKATLKGQSLTADQWKAVFLQALGIEQDFLPTLDGGGFFSSGLRSSRLSKSQMSDLIELIQAYAAEQGIVLNDPQFSDALCFKNTGSVPNS